MKILLDKIRMLLTPREKWFCIFLVAMMVVSTAMELLGIGLIMPIIALLSKPVLIQQNRHLRMIYDVMQPSSESNFIVMLCVALIVLFLVKNLFMIVMTRVQSTFSLSVGTRLANRLFHNYLHVPYDFHLSRNSSGLLHNLYLVLQATQGIIMPLIMLTSELLVLAAIFAALMVFTPLVVLPLLAVTVPLTAITYLALKKINYKAGVTMAQESQALNQSILQGLACIKECKIRNAEDFFYASGSHHLAKRNNAVALQILMGQIPRFVVEGILAVAGLSVLIAMIVSGEAMGSVVLKLSLFAVCLVRLMPSLTRIQYSLSTIKQQHYSFDQIYHDVTAIELETKDGGGDSIRLNDRIALENVSFNYESSEEKVIDEFSLEIKRNESVAFVGPTGCGKTTLIDVILGLLKPTEGKVLADGRNIEENLRSWQTKIGYVPQFIHLMDASIRKNVAYGVAESEINDDRVHECLKTAQVFDFVDGLPDNVETVIGENGVRLSGGQRQRLGIARALYHDPEILVLDEATSALDNETEKAFVDALKTLHGKLTIIMVAHRLTTVENCDTVVRIEPVSSPNQSTDNNVTTEKK